MTATMTTTRGATVIWPEYDENDIYEMDHAIAVVPHNGGVEIQQCDRCISVPDYAMPALIKALRATIKREQT